MPPDDDHPVRRITAARANLADPMSLSDVIRETVTDLDDGPTTAEWAQLVRLEIRPCKAPDRTPPDTQPVTDVQLPDTEAR